MRSFYFFMQSSKQYDRVSDMAGSVCASLEHFVFFLPVALNSQKISCNFIFARTRSSHVERQGRWNSSDLYVSLLISECVENLKKTCLANMMKVFELKLFEDFGIPILPFSPKFENPNVLYIISSCSLLRGDFFRGGGGGTKINFQQEKQRYSSEFFQRENIVKGLEAINQTNKKNQLDLLKLDFKRREYTKAYKRIANPYTNTLRGAEVAGVQILFKSFISFS